MAGNGKVQGQKKRTHRKAKRRAGQSHAHPYPFELRRKAAAPWIRATEKFL